MSFFSKIADIATGGIGSEIIGIAKKYLPGKLSPQEQQEFEMAVMRLENERNIAALKAEDEAERNVTDRIASLEGTASDLKSMPIIGPIVLFLRGLQRPLWGFATLYMDFMWFSSWQLDEQQQTALIVINFLVLGFLFGERAIKNLSPLIMSVWGKNKNGS